MLPFLFPKPMIIKYIDIEQGLLDCNLCLPCFVVGFFIRILTSIFSMNAYGRLRISLALGFFVSLFSLRGFYILGVYRILHINVCLLTISL